MSLVIIDIFVFYRIESPRVWIESNKFGSDDPGVSLKD